MTKVIASANQKGGVGKTCAAHNLGVGLAGGCAGYRFVIAIGNTAIECGVL